MFARKGKETLRCIAEVELPVLKMRQRLSNRGRNRAYGMIWVRGSIRRSSKSLCHFPSQFLDVFPVSYRFRLLRRFHLAPNMPNKRSDQLVRRRPKRQDPPKRLEQGLWVAVCTVDQIP